MYKILFLYLASFLLGGAFLEKSFVFGIQGHDPSGKPHLKCYLGESSDLKSRRMILAEYKGPIKNHYVYYYAELREIVAVGGRQFFIESRFSLANGWAYIYVRDQNSQERWQMSAYMEDNRRFELNFSENYFFQCEFFNSGR